MPSERAIEIMQEIVGATCITTEKFNRGAEVIDREIERERRLHIHHADGVVVTQGAFNAVVCSKPFGRLQSMLEELSHVHSWDGMLEIWQDRYAIQRLVIKYSLPSDKSDDSLRIFHDKDNHPRIDNEAFVNAFIKECLVGLEK